MKKILVLATFLVSLSFGNVVVFKPITNYLKTDRSLATLLFASKECKTVQDKVDGCKILKETKHGGIDQFVLYDKKQIIAVIRIFTTSLIGGSGWESKLVMCNVSPDEQEMWKKKGVFKTFRCAQIEANAQGLIPDTAKEFKGDKQSIIKQYVKQ